VPDASLTAAARVAPTSRKALADLREFSGRASRSELDRWWAAVQAGLTTTDLPAAKERGDTLPPPRSWSDRNPEADLRYKAARAAVAAVADALTVPVENLLTPEHLRRIAWSPPEPADPASVARMLAELGARSWQIDAIAQVIADAFVEGRQTNDTPREADS
jgi:ribonuclease D